VVGRPGGPENLGGDEGHESSGFGRQTSGGRSVEYRAGARLWSQAGKRPAPMRTVSYRTKSRPVHIARNDRRAKGCREAFRLVSVEKALKAVKPTSGSGLKQSHKDTRGKNR
jgi:hypothetical protein